MTDDLTRAFKVLRRAVVDAADYSVPAKVAEHYKKAGFDALDVIEEELKRLRKEQASTKARTMTYT